MLKIDYNKTVMAHIALVRGCVAIGRSYAAGREQ